VAGDSQTDAEIQSSLTGANSAGPPEYKGEGENHENSSRTRGVVLYLRRVPVGAGSFDEATSC